MRKHIGTARAAVLGVAAVATVVSLSGGASAAPTAYAPLPLPANSVGTPQIQTGAVDTFKIKDKSIGGWDVLDNTLPWSKMGSDFRANINKTINTATVAKTTADSATTKADAADSKATEALNKVNNLPQSPSYLKNWGEIFRNTIGNARAELGQSSSGEGLNISVPTSADAIMWGNEADFGGKSFSLSKVGYEVFQTGENSAIAAGNMPSIKFEISNPTDAATYTTLVYSPDNSASNAWTTIDAAGDTGKHWGFTGSWFNADPSRCGLNGARCTLDEALAVLGSNAKFISAGVGKGRDNAWHGAIRSLTVNDTTYKFTAGGVQKG
ncbi:hypothetical protein ACQPYH_34025 [Kribbella sp. CA-245084]|uniref:hypothetical protein n=1 Tax=Kribbella sp. CA-245084 TaxID=3239940 RepID=UPI003D8E4D9C